MKRPFQASIHAPLAASSMKSATIVPAVMIAASGDGSTRGSQWQSDLSLSGYAKGTETAVVDVVPEVC